MPKGAYLFVPVGIGKGGLACTVLRIKNTPIGRCSLGITNLESVQLGIKI